MDVTKYLNVDKNKKIRATFTLDKKVLEEFGEVINKIKDKQNVKINKSMLIENFIKNFINEFKGE